MFKVNNKNTRTTDVIDEVLFFLFFFEDISHLSLEFLLLNLDRYMFTGRKQLHVQN